jgi:hypothetical protein
MFGTAVFVIGEDGKLLSALQFWWGSLESQHRIDGGVAAASVRDTASGSASDRPVREIGNSTKLSIGWP